MTWNGIFRTSYLHNIGSLNLLFKSADMKKQKTKETM